VNGAFALHVPDHLCHSILWWYRYQHVDMIGLQMPFKDFALLLPRKFMENLPKVYEDDRKASSACISVSILHGTCISTWSDLSFVRRS